MTLDVPATVCNVEPFRYQATPQTVGDHGASANQINEQALEDYLNRLRTAMCDDVQAIIAAATEGAGVTSFLDLSDTPDSYSASAGKMVVVNGLQTGLEFQTQPTPPSYFLTPRLIVLWPPTATTNPLGQSPLAAGGAQIVIPSSPANALDASYRFGCTTATAAGSNAGIRSSAFQCIIGSTAPMGGFRLRWRFGVEIYAAGGRALLGLHPSTAGFAAIGVNDPSTLTNIIILGFDDTDTNWQIMHNDGAGTATKIDLGAGFAINTTSLLELTFEIDPSGTVLSYELRDLELGTSTSNTVSTNLPANTQPLTPVFQINAAATGVAHRISHVFMSIEAGPGE